MKVILKKINKPILKLTILLFTSLLIYIFARLTLVIIDIPHKFCTVEYIVSPPFLMKRELLPLEFSKYYNEKILPEFKEHGIKLNYQIDYVEAVYIFRLSFSEKIPSEKELKKLDMLFRNGIQHSYTVAMQTAIYYNYLTSLFAESQTKMTKSYIDVYKEFSLNQEEIDKRFPKENPSIKISAPDVRVISNLHPLIREIITAIFSFLMALTILLTWIFQERERI